MSAPQGPTDRAVVALDGHDFYLVCWGSRQSRLEYDRLIGEWIANGRRLTFATPAGFCLTELIAAYWRFAKAYYVKNGQMTATCQGITVALRILRES